MHAGGTATIEPLLDAQSAPVVNGVVGVVTEAATHEPLLQVWLFVEQSKAAVGLPDEQINRILLLYGSHLTTDEHVHAATAVLTQEDTPPTN